MALIVIGAILCVVAVVTTQRMLKAKKDLGALGAASPMTGSELAGMRSYGAPPGTDSGRSATCQVAGAAQPGPTGVLKSRLSGTECVWFRFEVTREYRNVDTDANGDRRTRRDTETWEEGVSSDQFQVVDTRGETVLVDPRGGRPDSVEPVLDRKESRERPSAINQMLSGDIKSGLTEMVRSDDGRTTAMIYQEWVIRPGTQLFVLGELRDSSAGPVVGKPAGRKHSFIISTKSAEEIKAQKASHHKWSLIIAPLAALVGFAFLAIGIFMRIG